MGVRNGTVTTLDFIAVVGGVYSCSRYKSAEHYNAQDQCRHLHCHENFRSCIYFASA